MDNSITLVRMGGAWSASVRGYRAKLKCWAEAALAATGDAGEAVSIVLAEDAFVHDLNKRYRQKDKPTNVLSFAGAEGTLGDIILACETIKSEAREQGKRFEAHLAHLVVHGILHLRGFDHETEAEASQMEQKEIDILKELGFLNPYALY